MLENLRKSFDSRSISYGKRFDSNITDIFESIINNTEAYSNVNEKIYMHMILDNYNKALMKLKAGNFLYADYLGSKAENLRLNLNTPNSIKVIDSILIPFQAYKYYVSNEFEKAKNELSRSFIAFQGLFELGIEEAIWAKIEQYLNISRITIAQENYLEAFNYAAEVVKAFLSKGTYSDKFFTFNEQMYIRGLSEFEKYNRINTMIDSIVFKLNTIKDKKDDLINSFLSIILAENIYPLYNKCISDYLNNAKNLMNSYLEVMNAEYLIPKCIEALILKKIDREINDAGQKKIMRDFSERVLNITY